MNTGQTISRNGLVCAYLLDGRGGARELEWPEVERWTAGDGVLWVHLNFSDPVASDWILNRSGIGDTIGEAMVADEIRPRSMQFDNGILAVLRGVNTNPGSSTEDMVSIRVWLEQNRIISTRRRKLLSIKDLRDSFQNGQGPDRPGSFITQLIERLVDRIGDVVNEMEEQVERCELRMPEHGGAKSRGWFSEIRRRAARIRRYLAPQREALDRLSRMPGEIVTQEDALAIHEEANKVTHYVEDLDLARERAMVAHEEMLSVLAHEQNSKMYLLSIVAAVFLPLSFLTGLMGMNVAGLPGTQNPASFAALVGLMAVVALAILLLFRIKKWL